MADLNKVNPLGPVWPARKVSDVASNDQRRKRDRERDQDNADESGPDPTSGDDKPHVDEYA